MGRISTRVYIIAGALTLGVFLVGILLGWLLDYNRVSVVQSQIDSLQLDFQNLELENSLAQTLGGNTTCALYASKAGSLSEQTDTLANELDSFPSLNQFQSTALDSLKKRYTILNLEFWMQLTNLQKTCGYNATTFVYFYRIDPNNQCDGCVAQGYVLDSLKAQYPSKVMIFAVDSNLDLGAVSVLKQAWNITQVPSIVVNGKYLISGFANQTLLQQYLK